MKAKIAVEINKNEGKSVITSFFKTEKQNNLSNSEV